jgi:hypothetical protein
MSVVAALLVTGCADSGVVGSSTVTGDYALQSINNSPLPVTTSTAGGSTTQITEDVFTLYRGGTYSRTLKTRTTVGTGSTTSTLTESGSYGVFGTSVTFRNGITGAELVAAYTPNTLTIVLSGSTSVYRK